MLSDMKNIKDTVEEILRTYPQTRDDDTLLQLAVLCAACNLKQRIGADAYNVLKGILLTEAPKLESIRRIRAKFQEAGFYLGKLRKEKLTEANRVRDHINGFVCDEGFGDFDPRAGGGYDHTDE